MPFPLPVPYTPGTGAIAIVEAVADDVIGIQPGQRVYCSPYHCVDVNGSAGEEILIGFFGMTPQSDRLVVLVARAMGAEAVFPAGRNRQQLEHSVALHPQRVRAVPLQGNPATYHTDIAQVAHQVDLYLDSLGLVPTPELTMAGIKAVRSGGTVVFNGGVCATLPVNYLDVLSRRLTIRGNFMYPHSAPAEIVRMIAGGLIPLDVLQVTAVPLEQVNHAIDRAATAKALELYALTP